MGAWEQVTGRSASGPMVTYRAWVPEPIRDLEPLLPERLLRRCEALTERMGDTSQQSSYVLDWFLYVADAAASTTIEDIYPSIGELCRAELGLSKDESAVAAVRNVRAVEEALSIGAGHQRLTLADICHIQRTLTTDLPRYEHAPGRFREFPVTVGNFVPPSPTRVADAMDDLVAFCGRTNINPLIHGAIAHARFEDIHPFPDGNGRTGRALVHALWVNRGLIASTRNIPFSVGLAKDRFAYYDALNHFHSETALARTPEALVPIIHVFADAVELALEKTTDVNSRMTAAIDRWLSLVSPRRGAFLETVILGLPSAPVVNTPFLAHRHDVSERTCRDVLRTLVAVGVLHPERVGRRRVYEATELIDIFREIFSEVPFADRGSNRADKSSDESANTPEFERQVREECQSEMRGGKRCVLRRGHAGQHRSTLPWSDQ